MLLVVHLYMIFGLLQVLRAQPMPELSAPGLDSLLQDYAFRALFPPKTGVPYDGNVPANLTGMKVSALRLRSGSLRRRGVSNYREFHIPIGVIEQPYVKRLVLVYHNLGNWSELYYPLPGYTYLAPVFGLLAYNGSDLSAKNLPELDIRASMEPIRINFSYIQAAPPEVGLSPKCVYFGIDGSVEFSNVIDQNVCSTTKQGHFSVVVEFFAPAPAPAPGPGDGGNNGGGCEKGKNNVWKVIVGSVVGGLVLIVLLGVMVSCLKKWSDRKKIEGMEAAADKGVPLLMAKVGDTKAPVASETRTRPILENEYAIL